MRRELGRHGIVFLGYFIVVMLLRWITLRMWRWEELYLVLGGLVGFSLVQLDRWVYVYYLYPHEQLSQQVQFYLKQKSFVAAARLIHERRGEQQKLVFRSFLFALAWVPLSIFALTSTGSLFAQGLVMGLGLHLVYDFWRDQRFNPQGFNQKLFWQVKRIVAEEEQRAFLYLFSGAFVVLTWVLV